MLEKIRDIKIKEIENKKKKIYELENNLEEVLDLINDTNRKYRQIIDLMRKEEDVIAINLLCTLLSPLDKELRHLEENKTVLIKKIKNEKRELTMLIL